MQDKLLLFKDQKLGLDLKDKDLKISEAGEKAANANERAAALEVEALKLRKELALQGSRENLLSGDN